MQYYCLEYSSDNLFGNPILFSRNLEALNIKLQLEHKASYSHYTTYIRNCWIWLKLATIFFRVCNKGKWKWTATLSSSPVDPAPSQRTRKGVCHCYNKHRQKFLCFATNVSQCCLVQVWGEEVECCGALGLGHCCRQLCHLQVFLENVQQWILTKDI